MLEFYCGPLIYVFLYICFPFGSEARLGKWMENSRELSTKIQISQ